ncbi:MAG: SHOCT domain-containing protein [Promethearchaeota archaeon]
MKDFEKDLREAIEDIEIEFDSEKFEQNMHQFGKKMKEYGEKIRESVEASVKHLSFESPLIHKIKILPRGSRHSWSDEDSENVREQEKERAKVKAPLEKIEILSELLNEGIITQEDFDVKKNQILDEI